MKSTRVAGGLDLKYTVRTHFHTLTVFAFALAHSNCSCSNVGARRRRHAVHSMLSHELSECVVMFQQVHGVASTQVMKPCAISALKALALDDAKHRETHPARSRLAPSAARSCQGTTARRAAATRSAIT